MKITVLMLAYNAQLTIECAIESVLSQKIDSELELLIIDDGSKDATPNIVSKWTKKDNRIVSVQFKTNKGVIHRLLESLTYASGDLICRLDADDEFIPLGLSSLEQLYSKGYAIYGPYLEKDFADNIALVTPKNIWECLAGGVLMGVNDIIACGGLASTDIGILAEYDLYARLKRNKIKFKSSNQPLLIYNRRKGSITTNNKIMTESLILLKNKWGEEMVNAIRSYD